VYIRGNDQLIHILFEEKNESCIDLSPFGCCSLWLAWAVYYTDLSWFNCTGMPTFDVEDVPADYQYDREQLEKGYSWNKF
jgi:hypothetical protein